MGREMITNQIITVNDKTIELMEQVGKGAFSEVYKGKFEEEIVAVKIIKENVDCIKDEIEILKSLKHDNIIKFFEMIQTEKIIIMTEFMHCTLDDLLYKQNDLNPNFQFELSNQIKIFISIEIGKAIKYLQHLNLIHGLC